MKYLRYLWYILRHKWFVFVECCRLGIPWLGVIHDWSKFLPSEFVGYARCFYGDAPGSSAGMAWLHHQKRNKHHWEYWLDASWTAFPMPDKYRREMLADLNGAAHSVPNGKSTLVYYHDNKSKMQLHPDTRHWLESQLGLTRGA